MILKEDMKNMYQSWKKLHAMNTVRADISHNSVRYGHPPPPLTTLPFHGISNNKTIMSEGEEEWGEERENKNILKYRHFQ